MLPAFSPFPTMFSTALFFKAVKNLESSVKELTHSHTMTPFDAPGKQAF